MARVLERLAAGTEVTAAELAEDEALPRSSVFDIVRRLGDAGLVARRPGGRLAAGQAAIRLGFAAFGLAPLHGPAEALLRLLRDETDGTAALVSADGVELASIASRWPLADDSATFEAAIGERASLRLTLRPDATRAARLAADIVFQQVVASLEHYLADGEA